MASLKMKKTWIILSLFVWLSFFGVNAEEGENSDVVSLTSKTFAEFTQSGSWLVKFFAPWCGHCKRLAPTWEELATAAKGKFNVAKVDCTIEKDICSQAGIRGYPTVKFINDGVVHDYNGARTIEAFSTFVEDFLNPNKEEEKEEKKEEKEEKKEEKKEDAADGVIVLTDADFAEKTQTGDWFIKFYAPWCGHCKNLAPTWDEFAIKSKGKFNVAKVDCTVQTGVCGGEGIRGYPTLKFFSEGKKFDYQGARTIEDFSKFVVNSKGNREEL